MQPKALQSLANQGANLANASHCRPQLHVRKAERHVDAHRALDRPGLQRHRVGRTADQEIFTDADATTPILPLAPT
jgi:hypothetical protein